MARILDAERHVFCQSDVRPLDSAGDASALRTYEVAADVPAGRQISAIRHGHSITFTCPGRAAAGRAATERQSPADRRTGGGGAARFPRSETYRASPAAWPPGAD